MKYSFSTQIVRFFATGFYSGLLPKAPGTFGSVLALAIWVFIEPALNLQMTLIASTFLIGIFVCTKMEKLHGKDPSIVVIDEFLGMFIALFTLTLTVQNIILSFVLFRFFDIYKPLGINTLQRIKGGIGIMIDDILAGLYSLAILYVLQAYIH